MTMIIFLKVRHILYQRSLKLRLRRFHFWYYHRPPTITKMANLILVILVLLISPFLVVDSIKSPCPRANYVTTNLDFQGKLNFICLQQNRLSVISSIDQRPLLDEHIEYIGELRISSFVDDEGTFRILLADSKRSNGTSMYAISRYGKPLGKTHDVDSRFVSAINTWKLNLNLEWHLAIAGYSPGFPQRHPIVEIYSWRLSYFDPYQSINLPAGTRVYKLEPMRVYSQEYLIIATNVNTLIYKLDFSDGNLNWIDYQSIEVTFALDVKSFEIFHQGSPMKDYYFVVLGNAENELIIYKYFGDKFVPTHSIPIPGATKLDAISYGSGDSYAVIAVLSGGRVDLQIFDGMTLKGLPNPNPNSNRVANFHLFAPPPLEGNFKRTLSEPPQLLLATSSENPNENTNQDLYQISVENAIKEDESHSKRNYIPEDLLSWCKSTINSILADGFDIASRKLEQLPRVDQNLPINLPPGDLFLNDLLVSNLLMVDNIIERDTVQPILINHTSYDIFEQVESVHYEIDNIKLNVDQILVDDGTVQEVHNPLEFETLIVESFSPLIGELNTIVLNSRNISDLSYKALVTGRAITIRQDLRFEHLVLAGRTRIDHTLNGLRIDDIVFKRGPARGIIHGEKRFLNGLYTFSNIRVDYWNGIEFGSARQSFLTTSVDQSINADLHFNQIVIDTIDNLKQGNGTSRIEFINEYNLDLHLEQIALTNLDNKFETPIAFDELILNGPIQMNPGSLLSSMNIDDLWLNTMFKQTNQNVTALFEFADDVHISFGSDIIVEGLINGNFMTPDNVLMVNRDFTFENPVIFNGDVYIENAIVTDSLNGIEADINPITGQAEFPILYDYGNQTITGDKILNEVYLDGQSLIRNINGVLDLNQLYSLANNNNNQTYRFQNVRLFGQNIKIADNAFINFNSSINGYPINQICSLAEQISNNQITTYKRLKFDQPINVKSIHCGAINGFTSLPNSFLTKFSDQRIAGTLRLVNGAVFNTKIIIKDSLNGLNISPLSRAIAQAVSEARSGVKEVRGDLYLEELIAGTINGLKTSDIFLARSDLPQFVRSRMRFDHLDIENVLIVGNNMFTNSFNALNLTDIFLNTLQYDTPQVIYNHLELNTLHLLPNSNFEVPTINEIDLKRLYADTVFIDLPQQILATKTFRAPVKFEERVISRHGINDLTNEELRFNFLLHSDDIIDGDLEIYNNLILKKELQIETGIINDIDVKQFVERLLTENQSSKDLRITGDNSSVRFKDVVLNNLVVGGTIQGINLLQDAISKFDNLNGTYDSRLREIEIAQNNRRLINSLYGPGSSFKVSSNYHGEDYTGACFVLPLPLPQPLQLQSPFRLPLQPPLRLPLQFQPPPPSLSIHTQPIPTQQIFPQPILPQHIPAQPIPPQPIHPQPIPPQPVLSQPIFSQPIPPQPILTQPASNLTLHQNWYQQQQQQQQQQYLHQPAITDYRAYMQTIEIRQLAMNINRFLSVSLYYEIATTHPLLGPLMHSAPSPGDPFKSHLFLKATGRTGIAVMEENKGNPLFGENSEIQETSQPRVVDSIIIGKNYYLFVLDESDGSHVIVFIWDYESGMYELLLQIRVDDLTTKMKAFVFDQIGCVALLSLRATLHCQDRPNSPSFNNTYILPIDSVTEIDFLTTPRNKQIIIASLSHRDTQNIGDLNIHTLDLNLKQLKSIASRKLVKPLKIHFFKAKDCLQLVVSEAITSNDELALTRIFTLSQGGDNIIQFYETQLLIENEIHDIQTVLLNSADRLVFLQSSHSISIYAPSLHLNGGLHYNLIHRLATKGANKFSVFNEGHNGTKTFGHYLVLSNDNSRQFSTIILKAKFS